MLRRKVIRSKTSLVSGSSFAFFKRPLRVCAKDRNLSRAWSRRASIIITFSETVFLLPFCMIRSELSLSKLLKDAALTARRIPEPGTLDCASPFDLTTRDFDAGFLLPMLFSKTWTRATKCFIMLEIFSILMCWVRVPFSDHLRIKFMMATISLLWTVPSIRRKTKLPSSHTSETAVLIVMWLTIGLNMSSSVAARPRGAYSSSGRSSSDITSSMTPAVWKTGRYMAWLKPSNRLNLR
mmetsp:Transcript_28900/g.83901  ORF Transcript_28900/g.83901 Transcript_28900/m.83901 type:complete len:238 (+) Transcript_28900:3175-3888(+)